jgi:cobalt-zinc-cadmium efflux system protein
MHVQAEHIESSENDHHRDLSDNRDLRNISIVFLLNLIFTVIEIVGGIYTNSVAILADALHDSGDCLALGIAWYFQKLAKRGSNKSYSYGYKRFSVLGALINSIVLLVGSVFILNETIPRLINPEKSHAPGMVFLSILGIVVFATAFFILRSGKSINERVVSIHMLEDTLGWVGVLIGAVVMWIFDIPIIDPILSILIMTYILYSVFRNLRQVIRIIMQATPSEKAVGDLRNYFAGNTLIKSYHDLHLWSLDGIYHILTVHIVVGKNQTPEEIMEAKRLIKQDLEKFHIAHPTLEVEFEDEVCGLKDH